MDPLVHRQLSADLEYSIAHFTLELLSYDFLRFFDRWYYLDWRWFRICYRWCHIICCYLIAWNIGANDLIATHGLQYVLYFMATLAILMKFNQPYSTYCANRFAQVVLGRYLVQNI